MTERRELMRQVPRGEAEIKYALRWAESVLREWHMTHEEATLIVSEPRRTLDQNAKLWPMLHDIADQVRWNDEILTPEDWKDIFTAALKKHRAVPGIDGGMVFLGMRTSRMKKSEFSELIELMYSWGAERDVLWSEPAKKVIDEHRSKSRAA